MLLGGQVWLKLLVADFKRMLGNEAMSIGSWMIDFKYSIVHSSTTSRIQSCIKSAKTLWWGGGGGGVVCFLRHDDLENRSALTSSIRR